MQTETQAQISANCNGKAYLNRQPRHDLCDSRIYILDAYGNVGARGSCKCDCHKKEE